MLSFLPCGVVPLVLPFDASACDALVFAVRCRATRASFRCQRVRCSRFCRAVSCHSCFLSIPARAMLSFLPCGVVPLVLPFDTSACDALVFAVRCRATRACVRDAAVSPLRVPVHKACYDAGLLGRGGVEKHMWLGIAAW